MDTTALADTPGLAEYYDRSADPDAARAAVIRFADANPDAAATLVNDERRTEAFVTLACASRSLTESVIRSPDLLDVVDEAAFLGPRDPDACRAALVALAAAGPEEGPSLLRRAKRREFLRIALRDLLGLADLVTVGRELSALADGCLAAAVALAQPKTPFAVIAMGKLGGNELNYASDVDVLFVHDGDGREADRIARAVLATMSTPTADGIVFRTDADLRPEGHAAR